MKIFLSLYLLIILIINISYVSAKELNNEPLNQTKNKCNSEKDCERLINQNKPNNLVCSTSYSPICGQINGTTKTYSNSCFLEKGNALYKYAGICGNKIISSTSKISNKNKVEISKRENDRLDLSKEPYLNFKLKIKVNRFLSKLIRKIDRANITSFKKKQTINKIISKLNKIKQKKPKLNDLINYMVFKLKEYIK